LHGRCGGESSSEACLRGLLNIPPDGMDNDGGGAPVAGADDPRDADVDVGAEKAPAPDAEPPKANEEEVATFAATGRRCGGPRNTPGGT